MLALQGLRPHIVNDGIIYLADDRIYCVLAHPGLLIRPLAQRICRAPHTQRAGEEYG